MPRATRRSLAEETPSRSSPRASTKASTAAAASPPAKTRGKQTASTAAEETKSRGRSSSRAKAAVATPPPSPSERPSRSRSRGPAAASKSTPTPPRRGRGKAKKEEEEEEEEDVQEEEEEEEVGGGDDVKPTKSRAPKKTPETKSSPAAKKTTTPARAPRGSRRSAESSAQKEEEKKTTPRRGRGRSTPTTTPTGCGVGEPEEKEQEAEEEEMTGQRGEEQEGQSETKTEDVAAEDKPDTKAAKEKREDSIVSKTEGEGKSASGKEDKEKVPDSETKMETDPPVEKETEAEKKNDDAEAKPEAQVKTVVEEKEKAASKQEAEGETSKPEIPGGAAETAPEGETDKAPSLEQDKAKEMGSVAAEPMEEEEAVAPSPTAQPTTEPENGEADDPSQLPRKPATKRKLDGDTEEVLEEARSKRARVNGTESDAGSSQQDAVKRGEEDESILLKDYEVVNKDEIPAPDSAEVAAAAPVHREDQQKKEGGETKMDQEEEDGKKRREEEKMEEDQEGVEGGSGEPVTVAPLTEAEVAKVYGSELQGVEGDDVSSTIVEVGSVAGADVSGTAPRGLDISELQSASNSIDGDDTADSSLNEGSSTSEPSTNLVSTTAQQQSDAAIPSAPDTTQADLATTTTTANGSSASEQPTPNCTPKDSSSSSVPQQNSHSMPPAAKGAGSVTESLGTPDPAFLAAYSSPGLLSRAYVPNPGVSGESFAAQDTFSVVSYNILAECHRRNSKYGAPEEVLGQQYRHQLLMRELRYLNGDVVCMQEVDPDYFHSLLLPAMRIEGYDGVMKRRTQEYFHEGEATFYKSSVFELETSRGVSLTESAQKEVESGGLSAEVAAAVNKYLDRADVVLVTRLKVKATGKVVTVGNIHVVWDHMKSTDVQCIQAACAVKEVVGVSGGSEGAHVVCGDFNAEWSSPVYQLMLDGYLSDSSIHTLQNVQRLDLDHGAKSLVNHLWKAFQHTSSSLKSTYATVTKSEPEVTSYSSKMKTVDYTFYSAGSLVALGVLKTVDGPVMGATQGLPTADFPSDHLALKSVLAFCK